MEGSFLPKASENFEAYRDLSLSIAQLHLLLINACKSTFKKYNSIDPKWYSFTVWLLMPPFGQYL